MSNLSTTSRLYALLFVHGDTIANTSLCEMLGVDESGLAAATEELSRQLAASPLSLTHSRAGLALVTRPEYGQFLSEVKQSLTSSPLSRAALETLTIIVYQPSISKAEIDAIRGVNSTLSLRSLVMRGLVERSIESGVPHYRPTDDTLRYLGVDSIEKIPHYAEFHEAFETNIAPSTD